VGAAVADDACGRVPLHWACISGVAPSVLRLLLDANVNASKTVDKTHGRSPLHYAVLYATTLDQVTIVLDAAKRAVQLRDIQGRTPIDLVRESPSPVKMEILDELCTTNIALSNSKKNGRSTKGSSDPKHLGLSSNHRQAHDQWRGETPTNHPMRQPSPPRQQQLLNQFVFPNRKVHAEKQIGNLEIALQLSSSDFYDGNHHNAAGGASGKPPMIQRQWSGGGGRPASPSATAFSAPEALPMELDKHNIEKEINNLYKHRQKLKTRPPSHPTGMDNLMIEKAYSPSKSGPNGMANPPSQGGFLMDQSLAVMIPLQKPPQSPARHDHELVYKSDDEIEYQHASPLPPSSSGRREHTWSAPALTGPVLQLPEDSRLTVQEALRQHAYDFSHAGGVGSGGADPHRTMISDAQSRERAFHGHTPQSQPSREIYGGSYLADGPGSAAMPTGADQYHDQHPKGRNPQEMEPIYGYEAASTVALPSTSNHKKQNLKAPPSKANLKSHPPSSNPETSNQTETLSASPPDTTPHASNLKAPPPNSEPNASNLKSPPPTFMVNSSNLKSPPPTTSNLQAPPTTSMPNTSNLKTPPPDVMALNDDQITSPPPQSRGAPHDPASTRASVGSLGNLPSFDVEAYNRKMMEYSSRGAVDLNGPAGLVGKILLDDMHTDIKSIEDKLAGRRKVLHEKNSQLATVESQLSEIGAKEEALGKEWETARASYEQQQSALGQRRSRVSQLTEQIAALQAELHLERSDLENLEAAARANEVSASRAEQQLLGTRSEFGSLGAVRMALESEKSFLDREVVNFESELKSLQALHDMATGGDGRKHK
jgi:flagellin-like hook-associated protein FlgL